MARVTIEDCIVQVPNRFDLVTLAARRSRDIASGSPLTIERDNDKNPIVALREIAEKTVSVDELSESVVQSLQRFVEVDDAEEEIVELGVSEALALDAPDESPENADASASSEDDTAEAEAGADPSGEESAEG